MKSLPSIHFSVAECGTRPAPASTWPVTTTFPSQTAGPLFSIMNQLPKPVQWLIIRFDLAPPTRTEQPVVH